MECPCLSCSKYRKWDKIDFLKKSKVAVKENEMTTRSDICLPSNAGFDRLPDKVLLRILELISPTNIDDFITIIALEMVSKRFQRCVVGNKKIWENVTELVMGVCVDLPDSQYLCHIGHYSLKPFLQRVEKITKVVITNDSGVCRNMMKNKILPLLGHFAGKLQIQELVVKDDSTDFDRVEIVEKFVNLSKQSLQSYQFINTYPDLLHPNQRRVSTVLGGCVNLKNVNISVTHGVLDLNVFLAPLRSLKSLEISGYAAETIFELIDLISPDDDQAPAQPLQLETLRLTNPNVENRNFNIHGLLGDVNWLLSKQNASSIRELEFHCCPYGDDLGALYYYLFDNTTCNLAHFKLTFTPSFQFIHTQKIIQLLQKVISTNDDDDVAISITFKHSEDDRDAKLAIVDNLVIAFDVPHTLQHEHSWEFVRGKLTVTLKLENIQGPFSVCDHDDGMEDSEEEGGDDDEDDDDMEDSDDEDDYEEEDMVGN